MKRKIKKRKYFVISIVIIGFITCFYYLLFNKTSLYYLKGITSSIFNFNHKSNNSIIIENNELNKQIEELKKFNKITSLLSDKIIVNGVVIKRGAPYYHDYITIDKGKNDGVKVGYGVINGEGLVGVVDFVNNSSSEVKLITNSTISGISAKFTIDNISYYGTLGKYDLINNTISLNDVVGDINKDKIKNIDVVTSGLSSNIPSGLIIGKIEEIKKDKYNLSSIVTLRLSSNLNDISIVSVVGKK